MKGIAPMKYSKPVCTSITSNGAPISANFSPPPVEPSPKPAKPPTKK